jgi:hypothetical protein
MKTEPFYVERLWKGKIQQAKYPQSVCKPDMYLVPMLYHNGQQTIDGREYTNLKNKFAHPDGLPKTYEVYSKRYWAGVEERKRLYRTTECKVPEEITECEEHRDSRHPNPR